ncbi:nucleotide-binding universal stress UspA family protein [Sphingomonas sp. PvP055]|jgi:nucleotide-binding universal stress UspA family protein|uniref:universal stress protein n=1 Tax=Sphingomonas sp. PvP055 TaxID=3156391 RepID=UPI003391F7CC
MKNILVLVHDDEGQEARLQVAFDIVRAVRGHLTCVDVVTVPVFVGDYISSGGDALLLADEQARESRNAVVLKERLAHEDIPYDWVDATGDPATCLRAAAKLSDLIVVNRRLDGTWYPDTSEITGELVAKGRRPVLAVPEGVHHLDLTGNVVIAWDGSDPAEAAMRAAVPLLTFAGSVTVLQVDDGSIKIPATEAAKYLSRHGITAMVQIEDGRGRKVTDVVRTVLASRSASYLVMGGFDHPRWVQSMFGGVTSTMIDRSPVPVLLAH